MNRRCSDIDWLKIIFAMNLLSRIDLIFPLIKSNGCVHKQYQARCWDVFCVRALVVFVRDPSCHALADQFVIDLVQRVKLLTTGTHRIASTGLFLPF